MSKEIKDYLHLYLGCWVLIKPPQDEDRRVGQFIGFSDEHKLSARIKFRSNTPEGRVNLLFFKPILRPLSDMTEEEHQEWMNLRGWVHENFNGKEGVENGIHCGFGDGFSAAYLLKQGFDLFGLIESGLAIDKTKLKNPSPISS